VRPQPLAPARAPGMLSAREAASCPRRIPISIVIRPPGRGPHRPRGPGNRLGPRSARGSRRSSRRWARAQWARRIIADERQPGDAHRLSARRRQPAPLGIREFDEWWVVLAGRLSVGADRRRGGGRGQGRYRVGAARDRAHIRNVGSRALPTPGGGDAAARHFYHPCEQCGFSDDGPREWCSSSKGPRRPLRASPESGLRRRSRPLEQKGPLGGCLRRLSRLLMFGAPSHAGTWKGERL